MYPVAHVSTNMHCAECVGGVIAGMLAGPLYGVGSPVMKKMLPWIHSTEIVKEDGKVLDINHPEHPDHPNNKPHGQHKNEIYDTSGTDAPLYPARPVNQNGQDGLTTIV